MQIVDIHHILFELLYFLDQTMCVLLISSFICPHVIFKGAELSRVRSIVSEERVTGSSTDGPSAILQQILKNIEEPLVYCVQCTELNSYVVILYRRPAEMEHAHC